VQDVSKQVIGDGWEETEIAVYDPLKVRVFIRKGDFGGMDTRKLAQPSDVVARRLKDLRIGRRGGCDNLLSIVENIDIAREPCRISTG
jgi:hypothetical protein